MTEAQWLAATEPTPMLEYIQGKASDRKSRLFACACCRGVWESIKLKKCHNAILVAELYADGCLGVDKAAAARRELERQYWEVPASHTYVVVQRMVEAALGTLRGAFANGVYHANSQQSSLALCDDKPAAADAQAKAVRCIFGNPFRPAAFSAEWRTDTAVSLARQMYESRDFSAMPILADALQDAGCDNADILNHCREPNGVHVRGCWVVDLVLGKG